MQLVKFLHFDESRGAESGSSPILVQKKKVDSCRNLYHNAYFVNGNEPEAFMGVKCFWALQKMPAKRCAGGVERSGWQNPQGSMLARRALPTLRRSANVPARQSAALRVCPGRAWAKTGGLVSSSPICICKRFRTKTGGCFLQLVDGQRPPDPPPYTRGTGRAKRGCRSHSRGSNVAGTGKKRLPVTFMGVKRSWVPVKTTCRSRLWVSNVARTSKNNLPVTFKGVKRSWDRQKEVAGHVYGGQT